MRSVMKPVFSLDRLAATDLTYTIIGASKLPRFVLVCDVCRQAVLERQRDPRLSVERGKCADMLNCQLSCQFF